MKSKHGRVWRFLFVLHLYGFLGVLGLLATLSGAGFLAWKVPVARRFVHSEVVRYYLRDVAPKLPFTIKHIDVDAKWKEFLKGWIRNLSVELRWNDWDLKLSGPIQISFDTSADDDGNPLEQEKHLNATYLPILEARAVPESKMPFKRIPPLPLTLAFRAEKNFSHLDSLTVHCQLSDWKWNEMHLHLQDASLGASWAEKKNIQVSFNADSIEFDDAERSHLLHTDTFSFSATVPISFSPLYIGPAAELDLSAKKGRTRWEGKSLSLPLSHFPLHARFSEDSLDLKAGDTNPPALRAEAQLTRNPGRPALLSAQWKTRDLQLKELLSAASAALPGFFPKAFNDESALAQVRNISGSLRTHGSATIQLPWSDESLRSARIDGAIDVENLSFEWPQKYLAVGGLDLNLPFSKQTGVHGSLDIRKILFRRFQGSLGKTELVFSPKNALMDSFRIHLGGTSESGKIPLKFAGLPLAIGDMDGDFSFENWGLETSLDLSATEVSSVMQRLCLSTDHIPPAQLVADFPKIEISPESIDPTGKLRVNLFDGAIELSELGVYELNSAVPEIDFDLNLDDVRLDQVGDWAGFGEMDGILQASAHDVVFQGWLPTQYDFKFEAKPLKHTKVVFSPEAMKNLARLVASDSIDHLPGIAEWMAFGLPSHLLGGYDIWFVGISLFSRDGHILLQVLDPPDLPISVSHDHKQNHYILYANRFTIPLKTSHYPLAVDATTVSNYIYGQAVPRLLKLRKAKRRKKKPIMKKNPWIALPLLFSFGFVLLGLFSCVTVNVNIPDSAVQQATDDYVKDLYEAKAKSTKPSPSPSPSPAPSLIHKAQYEIVATAYADEQTVSTQSPKAQDISDRLRARLPEITALKSSGILGESNEGKLTIQGKIKKADEKKVWGLVQNENGDRFELYHEIVAHNGLNKGNLETIARNFAHSFQKHSPSGTWVQDDAGVWSQKP